MAYHLEPAKKVLAISLLCEGSSIRAVERITEVHRDTIMRLGVRVGRECAKLLDERMRGLPCRNIEVDEIWGFVGKKQKRTTTRESLGGIGDVWTFVALDSESKVIPSFLVGKRDNYHTRAFIDDLSGRLANRIQLSSDAFTGYEDAVDRSFGCEVDYGQVVKAYSVTHLAKDAAGRYSPADVVKIKRLSKKGSPARKGITTSHVEKQNHTFRMHCRRLTRLTNAFSKKLENFEAAVALNFAYYNLVKTNIAVRMTPAQALGVESSAWTVENLVEACGEI